MRKFALFKHVNCTDLVIEPIRIVDIGKGRIKVKMKYYTCGYPDKLVWLENGEHTILKKDLVNWKPYSYN